MRVLVTGASGQLGTDLTILLKTQAGNELFSLSEKNLDITDQSLVKKAMKDIMPDIILHCAAFTNVDGCEIDPDLAFNVNAYGTRNIAVEAERYNSKMVYISTDYVFDGKATRPYEDFSPVSPISIYGASKLAGEYMVKQFCKRFFIIRTSWLFGWHGKNFVKIILQLAGERNEINVVNDQTGCPTFSFDLAKLIISMMFSEAYGIYHATNTGQCTWFEFAQQILKTYNIENVIIKPITTEEINRPAPRPCYSVLGNRALRLNNFPVLPQWQDSLQRFKEGCKIVKSIIP